MVSRSEAQALLNEWVQSASLKTHCLGVALCMEHYAKKYELSEEEIDTYWITGLLHDFDWEKHPTLEQHPQDGCKVLEAKEYPAEIVTAILGHANHTGVKRETQLAKTLFAVDELSGLVIALAKVRPGHFAGMTPKSVKKAIKKKDFAAKVNRDDIRQGIEELGVEASEHYQVIIEALTPHASELGF